MTQDAKNLAAADLADRYIEIILSTKPELLVYPLAQSDPSKIPSYAQKLTEFRQQLINGLAQQPLPDASDAP